MRYGDGERELYDLSADPFQLDNLVRRADPLLVQLLDVRLAELMDCAGVDCREIEDLPVDAERTASRAEAGPRREHAIGRHDRSLRTAAARRTAVGSPCRARARPRGGR